MTDTTDPILSKPRKPARLKLLVCFAVLMGIALAAAFAWQKRNVYHPATVQPGVLYRDGLKSESQFAATLDKFHPRTDVSLIDPAELADPKKPQLRTEGQLCAARGITLDRIPVKLGGWPTSEDVRKFLRIVSDPKNQPVIVHCAQGVRRTGFFVAAYQESILGYDKARAKSAVLTFGHSAATIDQIKRFIDQYDPKTQTVPADLGPGTE